jgi:hypothetical protein
LISTFLLCTIRYFKDLYSRILYKSLITCTNNIQHFIWHAIRYYLTFSLKVEC